MIQVVSEYHDTTENFYIPYVLLQIVHSPVLHTVTVTAVLEPRLVVASRPVLGAPVSNRQQS